jgi:hypothetical protein
MTYDNWKATNQWDSMNLEDCYLCGAVATCCDTLGRPLCDECAERLDYEWDDLIIDEQPCEEEQDE